MFALLILAFGLFLSGCCIIYCVAKTIVTYFPELTQYLGGPQKVYRIGTVIIIASMLGSSILIILS